MKIQIAAQGYATLSEVPPKMLEPGKLYSSVSYDMDDDGVPSMRTDLVWCHMDTLEKKQVRVLRFLIENKTKRYSQIVGTRFFGPMTQTVTEEQAPSFGGGPDIDAILAKAVNFQVTPPKQPVNEENIVLPTCIKEMLAEASTCPSCGKKNGSLQAPNGEEPPMFWCDPVSGGCDELWEAKL